MFYSNYCYRKSNETLIYNHLPTNNALSWEEFVNAVNDSCSRYMLKSCKWLPTTTLIRGRIMYTICIWLVYLLPALVLDAAAICFRGQKGYLKV